MSGVRLAPVPYMVRRGNGPTVYWHGGTSDWLPLLGGALVVTGEARAVAWHDDEASGVWRWLGVITEKKDEEITARDEPNGWPIRRRVFSIFRVRRWSGAGANSPTRWTLAGGSRTCYSVSDALRRVCGQRVPAEVVAAAGAEWELLRGGGAL